MNVFKGPHCSCIKWNSATVTEKLGLDDIREIIKHRHVCRFYGVQQTIDYINYLCQPC